MLAHRDELIQQAIDKLSMIIPDPAIGIVKAEQDQHDAPVVVASVQTLSRPKRLERLASNFATVVVDEAHHAPAETYRRVLTHLGSFDPDGPLTLGVTATPERDDGEPLEGIWEEIVYGKTILEMIVAGYLVDPEIMHEVIEKSAEQIAPRLLRASADAL
jgi:superfamily II DNA or RNA helicase